jgi:hypothetical protein
VVEIPAGRRIFVDDDESQTLRAFGRCFPRQCRRGVALTVTGGVAFGIESPEKLPLFKSREGVPCWLAELRAVCRAAKTDRSAAQEDTYRAERQPCVRRFILANSFDCESAGVAGTLMLSCCCLRVLNESDFLRDAGTEGVSRVNQRLRLPLFARHRPRANLL